MNIPRVLHMLTAVLDYDNNRQIGKTRSAVQLAKEVDGLVITRTPEEARRINKEYDVRAASIQEMEYSIFGAAHPVILDQDAMIPLLRATSELIHSLQEEVKELNHKENESHHIKEMLANLLLKNECWEDIVELQTHPDKSIRELFERE